MSRLNASQIAGYAKAAGFSAGALPMATAIALAESGGVTDVQSKPNHDGSHDLGLWQINDKAHPWITGEDWKNPAVNAAGAKRIYDEAKGSFTPWTTYKSGAAQRQLLTATHGASSPAAPDESWMQKAGGLFKDTPQGWVLDKLAGPGGAVQQAKQATDSVGEGVKLAAHAGAWISNPHNWLRVAYVTWGSAFIIGGLYLISKPATQPVVDAGMKAAKTTAKVAAVAAA